MSGSEDDSEDEEVEEADEEENVVDRELATVWPGLVGDCAPGLLALAAVAGRSRRWPMMSSVL